MRTKELLFLSLFLSLFYSAQVGINTATPDPSSVLDLQFKTDAGFTPKGMLTPRMTTAQRGLVVSPANGLLVYDTDIKAFFYYDLPALRWTRITSDAAGGRTNFKRLKSTDVLSTALATELAAGGGNKYQLNTNTLYEINGTVTLDKPIDLNNAYVQGIDSGEDVLVSTGNIFDGVTGGTIKGVTLKSTSGSIFNLNGAATQNLIFRDCIVLNSASVGTISNMGLVFVSTVQFAGNTTGITYNNISQLLLSNMGWFGNNSGTFEKLTGTFGLVQKQGGFSEVNGTAVGFDVSANPTITSDAVLESVVFTGTPTTTGKYINRYTSGSYTGYNFNNKWTVRSAGIPLETDGAAVGDVNLDSPYGVGVTTALTTGTAVKISGTTASNNFFRASDGGTTINNRLVYLGNKKRFFTVNAVASFRGTIAANTIYVFYVALNNIPIQRSKTYIFTNNSTDVVAVPIQTIVELSSNDFVEVYVQRFSGTSDMLTVSLSLFMK